MYLRYIDNPNNKVCGGHFVFYPLFFWQQQYENIFDCLILKCQAVLYSMWLNKSNVEFVK